MRCYDLPGAERFTGRAQLYARARPSYPEAAISAIVAGVETHQPVIDVGSGTGIASRLIADRGFRVIAVEPNREMLTASTPHERVTHVEARAEQLPLASGATDLIVSFNAFHWFHPTEFLGEAERVLRPGGRLAVVWNDWDLTDAFTREFVALMRTEARDHPAEDREAEAAPLVHAGHFQVTRQELPQEHVLDAETLPLRLQSMSYIPREGPGWQRLSVRLEELRSRYAANDGTVTHRYLTRIFLGKRS